MPTRSNSAELTAGVHAPEEPGRWPVQSEPPLTEGTAVGQLPTMVADQQWAGPQLFALVDACDPDRVYYYGVDVGTMAFTVRRDPTSHQTAFGSWISMQTAFERLDGLAGGPGRLALVVFDSAPAVAMMAMGQDEPAPAATATGELEFQPEWNWPDYLLDSSDHRMTLDRDTSNSEAGGDAWRTVGEGDLDPRPAKTTTSKRPKGEPMRTSPAR